MIRDRLDFVFQDMASKHKQRPQDVASDAAGNFVVVRANRELADAYLTFARGGTRVEPFAIAKVEGPDGRVRFEADPKSTVAMKPDTAHLVDFVLQQVISRGTGTAARLNRPVAGKTGTTENNGDAWFAGYTPDYAAVVWMGYPEGNSRTMDSVHGIAVTGGTLPAQIWKKFMDVALEDVPPDEFPAPPDALLAPPPDASSAPPPNSEVVTADSATTSTSTSSPSASSGPAS